VNDSGIDSGIVLSKYTRNPEEVKGCIAIAGKGASSPAGVGKALESASLLVGTELEGCGPLSERSRRDMRVAALTRGRGAASPNSADWL
jgi:hypothetical protein